MHVCAERHSNMHRARGMAVLRARSGNTGGGDGDVDVDSVNGQRMADTTGHLRGHVSVDRSVALEQRGIHLKH
jgi:hypothetical protein